ncbi:hypothetical protein NW765_006834 [Fusarium oxysporum]|nr:hypothetical protein FOWG_11697 [Fusarium oxysporum f. sp. lycopersici MN25]KAJ4123790.1 hypothetical protein NW765_006834 [Fusarium oxysporum]
MPVTEIRSQDDYEKLLKKYKVVIINANASWAGPCKAMKALQPNPLQPGILRPRQTRHRRSIRSC